VSNEAMGYIFEELLRKFSEMSNETAGEHYTPREVIRLMVNLLVSAEVRQELTDNPKPVRTVYDPAAGTGGMLMTALHHIKELNPRHRQRLRPGAQRRDLGDRPVRPDDAGQRAGADAQRQQPHPRRLPTEKFDYILANPPYGVDWKAYAAPIKDEHAKQGFHGRFGAGLPRVSDGSLLFLQHMLST
jgi:type I restriction enzyme M protein